MLPIRGGNWNNGALAGVFNLNLNNDRSNSNTNNGARPDFESPRSRKRHGGTKGDSFRRFGAQTHTLTSGEMPAHAHGVNDPTHGHSASQDNHTHEVSGVATGRATSGYYLTNVSGGFENRIPVYPNSTSTNSPTSSGASASGVYVGGAYTGISIQNAWSGGAHNNVQPTLVTNYIVKV